MIDRRQYPRLSANVIWRSAGLDAPLRPTKDISFGGMLVYSDEAVPVGARLEIDLLEPEDAAIELDARVVRVEPLPAGAVARYDVALEFLDVPRSAKSRLAVLLGVDLPAPSVPGVPGVSRVSRVSRVSEPRVHEEKREEVHGVEHQHEEERLLQTPESVPLPGGPDGDGHVREQDRDQDDLLHGPAAGSEAHGVGRRNENRDGRGRRRVLFVTPYLPSPPRFGGQRRLHGLISGLAASHDVSVLSLVDPSEDQTESLQATAAYCRSVVTVPNPRYAAGLARKRLLQLGSLLTSRSYERLLHTDRTFESTLDRLVATEGYDVVHFEFPHLAAYRYARPDASARGPAFLLDEHNIEYDIVRQTARAEGSALRRAYSAINWRKVKTEEKRAWARLDGCTLTSARDQGMLLEDAPGTRTAVVPNGVDLEFFQPRREPEPRLPATLLFFGAIDYHPNTDGLLFFLREIWPLLGARVPRVKLCIVGRRPPEVILAAQSADVEVTGAVDDLRPYLERATVVIAPLRMGGGTRLKIIEAMAMGKAVVSTTLGAEGLDVVPERDLLIADDPRGFAAQVGVLLDDRARVDEIGAAARRVVEAHYGWGASVERLSSFYGEVLEARAGA